MSVEYELEVRRKCDNKLIGAFIANEIKTIIGSEFDDIIYCDNRISNSNFTVHDLENISKSATMKLNECYEKIFTQKIMLMTVDNEKIRNEIKEEMCYLTDVTSHYIDVIKSISFILGMISEVVENDINISMDREKEDCVAYCYNGKDLPKQKHTYRNDDNETEYECDTIIWNDDVICSLKQV